MSPVIHAAACQEALARLPKLDRDELRQQWRALYQAEASPHLSRELLVRAVAYGMQELALGGLRAAPQRQLRQFAQQLKANAEVRIRPRPELKPGTRLLREWRGRTYEVLVLEAGFLCQGTCYRSLSALARKITGTAWSGPLFFGLKPHQSVTPARVKSPVLLASLRRIAMPRSDTRVKRCAIYTRKSSEEGLEQQFNSLAAQREACEAYIRSQQHEGWASVRTRYDDGGFSGGNLERPALQRLLADIRTGRIDVVVVYKVDRLTRSLADFARLVEIFDAQAASFVSVTQQFNTTSSMGRLTLNVLLSFAQFEREVTGERIRDKIAASKKKGMWMGGNVPLGYDASDRTLVINRGEAETVRRIFALYREFGCVRRVKDEADRLGLETKRRTTASGAERGGKAFSRGHIYRLLANPIYTGQIAHQGKLYPGQHPALIEAETWSAVRDRLAANAGSHRHRANAAEPSLLAGLLADAQGDRLTPSHAVKNGRRYRYYVSAALITEAGSERTQGWRIAATEVEHAVIRILVDAMTSPGRLLEQFQTASMPSDQVRKILARAARLAAALNRSPGERRKILQGLVEKILIAADTITIRMRRHHLLGGDLASPTAESASDTPIELTAVVAFKRRGVETKLVLPGLAQQNHSLRPDPALIKAIARGRAWFEELATGRVRSLQQLADRDGITRRYIRRLVNLAFLSPELVEAILQGRQSIQLTATRLTEFDLPLDWTEQHRLLSS